MFNIAGFASAISMRLIAFEKSQIDFFNEHNPGLVKKMNEVLERFKEDKPDANEDEQNKILEELMREFVITDIPRSVVYDHFLIDKEFLDKFFEGEEISNENSETES